MRHEQTSGGNDAAALGERNDCTVLSFEAAVGIPYLESHAILKGAGRKDKHGIRFKTVLLCHLTGFVWGGRYMLDRRNDTDTTLRAFVEAHQEGRYIVLTDGHALALVDGVIHDNHTKPRLKARVKSAWKLCDITPVAA